MNPLMALSITHRGTARYMVPPDGHTLVRVVTKRNLTTIWSILNSSLWEKHVLKEQGMQAANFMKRETPGTGAWFLPQISCKKKINKREKYRLKEHEEIHQPNATGGA